MYELLVEIWYDELQEWKQRLDIQTHEKNSNQPVSYKAIHKEYDDEVMEKGFC